MKLYISYYGNYVSIVEGKYNNKKDKYTIKNCMFLSSEDKEFDYSDKYSLLKEALSLRKWKTKDAILCLNTRDVIIKNNHVQKAKPKDLDGIMNNEMADIMSLDYDQYSFSYEVTKENLEHDQENLDVILAAISNDELDTIIDIFKDFKLNLKSIDTISTAYGRLLKKIEYNNMMMINIGSYGSIVDIFKEDSLFIHDNIPVKINEQTNEFVCMGLVEEIKGLMNYYSSRNYGNSIETLVLLGQANGNEVVHNTFKDNFSSNTIIGIENVFDIEEDIIGDIDREEISKIADILGIMSVKNDNKSYSSMNLLPARYKHKQNKKDSLKQYIKVAPIGLAIIFAPYIVFGAMDMTVQKKIDEANSQLNIIETEYKDVKEIKDNIKLAKEEVEIYNLLMSKDIYWGDLLDIIDANIPYKAELINVNAYYDVELDENANKKEDVSNENSSEANTEKESEDSSNTAETEEPEVAIYDQIPNKIVIDGAAQHPTYVGQFVYNLNKIPYFKSVELKNTTEDQEKGVYNFNIVLVLKEGVISGE